jgi:hypothetical protein
MPAAGPLCSSQRGSLGGQLLLEVVLLLLQLSHALLSAAQAGLEIAVVLDSAVWAAIGKLRFETVVAEEAQLVAAQMVGGTGRIASDEHVQQFEKQASMQTRAMRHVLTRSYTATTPAP